MIYILGVVSNTCSSPALGSLLLIMKNILSLIQLVGPILALVSLTFIFIRLMTNPENKKLKNAIKNWALALVLMFFVPVFVNVVMGMMDNSFSVASCWESVKVSADDVKFHNTFDGDYQSVLVDPESYEKGEEREDSSSDTVDASGLGSAKTYKDVVWDSSNVTKISNLTSNQLVAILNKNGGKAKNFVPYAPALIKAENKYSVNVFFLLGVEALESGWMTSSISKSCNNLGGVCQSSKYPSKGCGSNSNCKFAYFDSPNEFIDYHANMLHKNYLTPGGSYYNGKSPYDVVKKYCPGCSSWPKSVISIADQLLKQAPKVM